jgi:hypothetical protein
MAKSKRCKRSKLRILSRPEELVEFLQDVGLGKRKATEREVEVACKELDQYLPEKVTRH